MQLQPVKMSQPFLLYPSPSPPHLLSTFRYFLIPPENDLVLVCPFLCTSSTRPLNSENPAPSSSLPGTPFWPGEPPPTMGLGLEQGSGDKENHPKPEMWELVSHCSASAPSFGNRGSSLRSEVPCHTRNPQDSSSVCPQMVCTLNGPAARC